VPRGEAQQAAIETVDPAIESGGRDRERHQAEARLATHRGDVAQPARQRLVSDILGPVGRGPKMHAFEQQVRGEEQVVARAGRAVDGAVIADPEDQLTARRKLHAAPDALDERNFAASVNHG
jgi:hypothetical protein